MTDTLTQARGFFAASPRVYVGLIVAVMIGAFGYRLRTDGVFACQASGYVPDRYLAYCQALGYGDYEHGAFWFGLEPAAVEAASRAKVLVLGNSRMQLAMSTAAMDRWFDGLGVRHYLLGFSNFGNYTFEVPLLRKLGPRAAVYVINLDGFFNFEESAPGRVVMRDTAAAKGYRVKRLWQRIHQPICGNVPPLCADQQVIFRSRATGAWQVRGGVSKGAPVSYTESINQDTLKAFRAAGEAFLRQLPVNRECVILTMVPSVKTPIGTGRAIAAALGLPLVAPEVDSLETYDGSHLGNQSAERWSAAFLAAAGPRIRACLDLPTAPSVPISAP